MTPDELDLDRLAERIEKIASSIPPPNPFTPELLMLANAVRQYAARRPVPADVAEFVKDLRCGAFRCAILGDANARVCGCPSSLAGVTKVSKMQSRSSARSRSSMRFLSTSRRCWRKTS